VEGERRLAAGRREDGRQVELASLGADQGDDGAVLGHPALALGQHRGPVEAEPLLREHRVAAVQAAERHEAGRAQRIGAVVAVAVLGEEGQVVVVDVAWPRRVGGVALQRHADRVQTLLKLCDQPNAHTHTHSVSSSEL
jgi:hypothetical protein